MYNSTPISIPEIRKISGSQVWGVWRLGGNNHPIFGTKLANDKAEKEHHHGEWTMCCFTTTLVPFCENSQLTVWPWSKTVMNAIVINRNWVADNFFTGNLKRQILIFLPRYKIMRKKVRNVLIGSRICQYKCHIIPKWYFFVLELCLLFQK